ncbi:MAG: IcmT/TraK family protein [Pseudomonadota bacterium]|nr:IcmT/TraK family protein [Gammaproteobacteria bacterium]MBU1558473.1 IcmT/TraK family protein [Gammaproteobacteria bacterium]MBU1629249.1 IcmT/TraK family protein [Gammaproteobacteria bacterium]MBU1926805.1 IcmT/TraK family protein [Gammaproteobacteria bacterium]MBU2546537.1 IcmT/TraK family protein [Gammaproteobacteria bacterium]
MGEINAYWRDSARRPQFFFIDGWAVFPMVLFLLHIRLWTFAVAIAATAFFSFLSRYGFTVPVFLRLTRGFITGPRKMAHPWWE